MVRGFRFPVFGVLLLLLVSVVAANQGAGYIVHLDKTVHPENTESVHVGLLSSVFSGSHEKAKESILYSYKNTINGFSAKLSPEQASDLGKTPGVLAVTPQGVKQLHGSAQGGAVSGKDAT